VFVLDTNVVSEFTKPKPDEAVMVWLATMRRDALFLPSVVVAELVFGIERLPPGKKRKALADFTGAFIEAGGPDRVLSFGHPEALAYARIGAHRQRIGRPMKQLDAQIGATALVCGFPVVTRNVRDFEDCGIKIVNPWEARG
jgi:predicted nucleic acid-binding protein